MVIWELQKCNDQWSHFGMPRKLVSSFNCLLCLSQVSGRWEYCNFCIWFLVGLSLHDSWRKTTKRRFVSNANCGVTAEFHLASEEQTFFAHLGTTGELVPRVWTRNALDARPHTLSACYWHSLHDWLCRSSQRSLRILRLWSACFGNYCFALRNWWTTFFCNNRWHCQSAFCLPCGCNFFFLTFCH